MVTTDAVKRALAALAARTDTATRPYVAVVDEGDAARGDLRRAASFLDAVGLDRLREAADAAERDGADAVAARGRDALADYRALREAASGSETTESTADSAEEPPAENPPAANSPKSSTVANHPENSTAAADHFHSAPGTPKREPGQGSIQ